MRMARWRRWASSLPVIVALLFATTTVASTVEADAARGSGHVLLAVQAVNASTQQAAGQRPDVPIVKRAGSWTVTPDPGALAWAPERAGTRSAGWRCRLQDAGEHGAQARRGTYQGRGPPGRRAATSLS